MIKCRSWIAPSTRSPISRYLIFEPAGWPFLMGMARTSSSTPCSPVALLYVLRDTLIFLVVPWKISPTIPPVVSLLLCAQRLALFFVRMVSSCFLRYLVRRCLLFPLQFLHQRNPAPKKCVKKLFGCAISAKYAKPEWLQILFGSAILEPAVATPVVSNQFFSMRQNTPIGSRG